MEKEINGAVRCYRCINLLDNGTCKFKKGKLNINKKRRCEFFELNTDMTYRKTNSVPIIRGVVNKALLREERYRLRKELKAQKLSEESNDLYKIADYPLTGDLSKFKTSASISDSEEKA